MLSSWVAHNPGYIYTFFLDGPAVDIFTNKIGRFLNHTEEVLTARLTESIDFVLTATSWASDIERKALKFAKKNSMYSISYLDHWCNYTDRFECGSGMILPDEIWVGDEDAYKLARTCFDGNEIRLVPNLFFQDIKNEFSRQVVTSRAQHGVHVLYVCESIVESGIRLSTGELIEYKSMDLFFEHLNFLEEKENPVSVRLRLHPAEPIGKYDDYLSEQSAVRIKKSHETSLIEDCMWADWVVGMNTMALIVARIGGKRVGYCNLDAKKPNNLPTTGMVNFLHLRTLE